MGVAWGVIVATATAIGGVAGYLVGLWKSKEEIAVLRAQREKTERELAEMQLGAETRTARQILLIITRARKKFAGTPDLAFSEDDLYAELGEYAPRMHAALDGLRSEGRAKESLSPGMWFIE